MDNPGGYNPSRLSGRPQKGCFEDILADRRQNGDFHFITRTRCPQGLRLTELKSPAEIREAVLDSARLKHGVKMATVELGITESDAWQEVERILTEMCHNLSMTSVRSLGYVLAKAMKQLYRGVWVNRGGIEQLRRKIGQAPVVLLPSHRSYADFLLLSYVCFDYDLPMPVIAAAMDFMGMKFFGQLMRNCGAFFIRRSFASDRLYWLVFTEYVKVHTRLGQYPVEFFAEGTRSRTGKSLVPKTGMLATIVETWILGEVSDIWLVPVNISHQRILEESLYAYEMLGVPKPKESTSGLLKARRILSEDFGHVHIYLDTPISLRELANRAGIDRSRHNLQNRLSAGLFPEELTFTRQLARLCVVQQQRHAVLPPISLVAALLLATQESQLEAGVLADRVEWLAGLVTSWGAMVNWPGTGIASCTSPDARPAVSLLEEQLAIHSGLILRTTPMGPRDRVVAVHAHMTNQLQASGSILPIAAAYLQLASYRNQVMFFLAREAILSVLITAGIQDSQKTDYILLDHLFSREFVYELDSSLENFAIAQQHVNQLATSSGPSESIHFLSALFQPFLLSYWLVCWLVLTSSLTSVSSGQSLAKRIQTEVLRVAAEFAAGVGVRSCLFDTASMDLLNNAVAGLRGLGVMAAKVDGPVTIDQRKQLQRITDLLGELFLDKDLLAELKSKFRPDSHVSLVPKL